MEFDDCLIEKAEGMEQRVRSQEKESWSQLAADSLFN
jgi:hypothetical protein